MREATFIVQPDDGWDRLDRWLVRRMPDLSRTRIQALMRAGCVTMDGRRVRASEKPAVGSVVAVRVPDPEPAALQPEDRPLRILYEDADVVVIDKPAGWVVHPGAGHATGTLVNALLAHCGTLPGIGGTRRPGIVHRLDKDTSGALVVAKSDKAMESLSAQFKNRTVDKEYDAIVWGAPPADRGRIDRPIGRHPVNRKKMCVRAAGGRAAVTEYAVTERCGRVSLLRVRILTGRTHQIRVHLAAAGCPVVGDADYGGKKPKGALPLEPRRQMLHARRVGFDHPITGRRLRLEAPLPPDFLSVLKAVR